LVAKALTPNQTYHVDVKRDGDWWLITIPDVPRARSQARRLDQVEGTTRDLLSLVLQIPEDDILLDVDIHLPGAAAAALARHRELRRKLGELQTRVGSTTEETARLLVREGHLTYRDAARLLGLSFQRVHKLVGSH
jgi:hypothetical protein